MKLKTLLFSVSALALGSYFLFAQTPSTAPLDPDFQQTVKPFLTKNCAQCHNADNMTAGVRVDHLHSGFEDRHIRIWEGVRHRVRDGSMPPKGMPQPSAEERRQIVDWIAKGLEIARSRPAPKNGLIRRLTVAQYRNTLRDLLQLEDDLTETLPPDAISRDGFINNQETLQLSPLQLEAYLDIAEEALTRAIVDPARKPAVQNFRVDLGASINKNPLPEELILGANSLLLANKDFTVTQLTAKKPFPVEPFFMRTNYRFIEGYEGNATVRGWREFDSIYHSVFACMRGKGGYPKGLAYSTVPEGLLLRPAIPNDELFGTDGTYGPRANFKISLRELPDHGRFRVTVTAAKYTDGLMLDPKTSAQPENVPNAVIAHNPQKSPTITIPKAGVYQLDVHASEYTKPPAAVDSSRLSQGLSGSWPLNGDTAGLTLDGTAKFVDSPFGQAVSITGQGGTATIARTEAMNVGDGEFTVSAWIHPRALRHSGIVALGGYSWMHGWYLDIPDNKGILRFESNNANNQSNGTVSSPPGVIRANAWQHVAAVVQRGRNQTRLYVNGFLVAKGEIGSANLDNPNANLHLGRIPNTPNAQQFRGEIDEVRIYRRALADTEIQGLVEPGRQFAKAPPEKPQELHITLGNRDFSGLYEQPAFAAVRLDAGPLTVKSEYTGLRDIDHIVLTPLATGDPIYRSFLAFEKRVPKLGVHLGFRRDCGSTFAPVGKPQPVAGTNLAKYVFEGAIRNYPSPEVEKDNVNYLAGVREIAIRSEYTDGRDMPRLLIRSVEFEGPFYDSWPPATHRNIFTAPTAREVIRNFASRAWRRPITAVEEASLMETYGKSSNIKDALQVILTSPQFLFLVETSNSSKSEPLTNFELASKLSYFLWNSPPDKTTLALASNGTLKAQLTAEVDRMVASPHFSNFVREFASQWLSLDKFQVLEPDRKRYPDLTRDTRAELRQEPIQFVEYLLRKNLPVRNLIDSDFIVANETVASYYGIGDKTESGFQFVAVNHGRRELGGVLTQAAIMAGLSDGRESNPVKRGAWLARKIVAEPPADPPPNVPALKDDPDAKLTLRQRIEQHRNQPGCRQCHSQIDPWGVAFEEFDAGGRLKKEAADARSTLPDKTEVAGIYDLKRYLSQDRIDQVAFSVMKHMATYATGRTLSYNEISTLKRDGVKLRATGYRMRDMIHYIVNSSMFLEK